MSTEVKVPNIGDFKEVEIIELMVKVGDTIAVDQSLVTVESDKASMEIPSTHAGVVKELKVKVGDKVSEGTLMLVVDEQGGAAAGASGAGTAPLQRLRQPRHPLPRQRLPQPHQPPLLRPCQPPSPATTPARSTSSAT